jgi:alkylation response protein AidB-like acyl-CoA dehydrogenase
MCQVEVYGNPFFEERSDAMNDDDRMIADAAAAYCKRDPEYRRVRGVREALPSFERAAWSEMAEMGWIGGRLSEAQGGTALGFQQLAIILEQYGRSLSPEPLTAVGVLAAGILSGGSNEALKAKGLARLAAGTWMPTLAWQEGAGPLAAAPEQTRATARAGRIVLDGTKTCVAVGEAADAFIVSALGDSGCELYLVERDAAGVGVTTHRRVDGGTWSDVALRGVCVEPSALIAGGAHAAALLERVLDEARLAASAELVGLMSAVFDITVDYLKVRQQFGKPIGSFQALQHRAVDLYMQVEIARAVLRQTAALFDTSTDPRRRAQAASQLKARASDGALKVAKGAVQLHGGIAYTDECKVGLFLKRAMVLAAWLGNASMHRARHGALAEAAEAAAGAASEEPLDPLQREARAFVEANFPAEWRFPSSRMRQTEVMPWLHKLHEKGWGAPGWPKEFGGMGLSAYDQIKLQEEFDRYGVMVVPNMGIGMLGPLLIRYGTERQRHQYLPRILAGEMRWCQGYSEPGAGSDLASLRTSAVLDGDAFVVNGQKIWTSLALDAHMIFMLVRTDPEARKQEGISFLLADMKSPGITVRRIVNISGESEFCEVFFDNVRVPKENLVGEINRGWMMAKSLLGSERIMVGSPRLARYPLQLLKSLLRSGGGWQDPVLRARFDELQLDVDDLAAAYIRMVDVLRHGGELGAEVSLLKIWITEAMQRVTDMLLDVSGDSGVIDEAQTLADGSSLHVARQYFLSRPATIYAGSNEIQRNIIAKAILGLPG